ncbi:MAG: hypothetical protein M3R69_18260 [Acidobacteriota bacterium]|nr:hypothetical protein [Acidobacteriota bacterium]
MAVSPESSLLAVSGDGRVGLPVGEVRLENDAILPLQGLNPFVIETATEFSGGI